MTWKEIDTEIPGEMESWENMQNGEVLTIERRGGLRSDVNFQVVTLPENWENDNQVIDLIDTTQSFHEATVVANAYRKGESE